jgi:hypothetical protein
MEKYGGIRRWCFAELVSLLPCYTVMLVNILKMKKLLLLVFFPLFFQGCHKNEDNTQDNKYNLNYTHEYISGNIKSLEFLPGTYWIYWSDSLKTTDSSFIISCKSGFYEVYYGLGRYVKWEYYSMSCRMGFPPIYPVNEMFIESDHILLDPKVGYPHAWGPLLYTYDTASDWPDRFYPSRNRYLDSLRVGNEYFLHVQECKFRSNSDSVTCYTKAGIGIVKKVITIDSVTYTWDLIRWHITR